MRVHLLAFCAVPLIWSGAACASEPLGTHLEAISGKVLVNQGEGFVAATSAMTLKRGTKILVGDDGAATLSYAQKQKPVPCYVNLKPATVTTVTDSGVCASKDEAALRGLEDVTITPVANDDPPPSQIPPPLVGVGFFTIVAGAAIYTLLDDDNDSVSAP